MRGVKLPRAGPLVLVLACLSAPCGADTGPPVLAPLAHSSLVTLEGATTPEAVTLRVRPTNAATPVTVSELSVAVDGKKVPATAGPDATWLAPLPQGGRENQLDVTVTHDGVRELLSAKITRPAVGEVPAAAHTVAASGVHRQIVWWILNVVIVLVAAIAISRRTS